MSVSTAPDPCARQPERACDFLSFMRTCVVLHKAHARSVHPADELGADLLFSCLMDDLMRDIALTVGSAMRGATDWTIVRQEFIDALDQALALPLPDRPVHLIDVLGDGIEQLWEAP
ncbi:MAG: hypothetical protein ACXWVD_00510 [Telluria sp.]